jgi:quinol monooxygenase YgiN
MSTVIRKDNDCVTLINVFTVKPEHQQELADILIQATEIVMKKQPGYISSNFHKSLDGTKVTNYAQWRSKKDFDAMRQDPQVQTHMKKAQEIAVNREPFLYEVIYTDSTV